ncbi:MAG: energy-coupled thiamine transporter ThiT [Parasporobacterium sp.]|nr:energy-coupled thiamine transporter ThiT [Parasporobacterium sp.]
MSFFVTPVVDEWGDTTYVPTAAGLTILIVIIIAVLLLGVWIFGKNRQFSAKQLAFTALAIALATATSFIKVIHMPMGGSVTFFSMLFIALVGYWYGPGPGLTAAFAYGILQMTIDPYILSFPQMLVDYVFAFTALGLSGIFTNAKRAGLIKGYLLAVFGRYVFAVVSGWVFFGIYAGDYGFKSGLIYSLVYNIAYIGIEAAVTVLILFLPPVRNAMEYVKRLAKS